MTVLALKVALAPLLVALATLAGRRWGAVVAGIVTAVPVVAGPILAILTIEHGRAFGAAAARGALLGVVALSAFCVGLRAPGGSGRPWLPALAAGWVAYLVVAAAASQVDAPAGWGLLAALGALALSAWLIGPAPDRGRAGPRAAGLGPAGARRADRRARGGADRRRGRAGPGGQRRPDAVPDRDERARRLRARRRRAGSRARAHARLRPRAARVRALLLRRRTRAVTFTAAHRGGSGPPLVLLHGFTDTWRVWELVLPALERHHDVLAPTLPGHAGGPPLTAPSTTASWPTRSSGRWTTPASRPRTSPATRSAATSRCSSPRAARAPVVALAPAGGWAAGDASYRELLEQQRSMRRRPRRSPARRRDRRHAEGRRRATRLTTMRSDHIPPELLAHQLRGVAGCDGAVPLIEHGLRGGWTVDAERIACPVRIVWGTEDRLLPWPAAAARYRRDWLPHADWVELDGVGHCPQLDVPLETAQLILGVTAP